MNVYFVLYRGHDFHKEFSNISQIRAMLQQGQNLTALTATATCSTRKVIIRTLEMFDCHVIAKIPSQCNITYHVKTKPKECVKSFVAPLVEDLRTRGDNADKTIIYCTSYKDNLAVFQEFVLQLGEDLTVKNINNEVARLFEKYDACTEASVKSEIVKSFAFPLMYTLYGSEAN